LMVKIHSLTLWTCSALRMSQGTTAQFITLNTKS